MSFPVYVHLFGQSLLLHGVCEFLGIFIAFRYYLYLRRKQLDYVGSQNRIVAIIAATFGAVVGARVLGTLENVPEFMAATNKWAYFMGNKTMVGGLIGALLFVEIAKKIVGEKQNTGDLFTYPLIIGMIIGRIGCFSAGVYEEAYGLPSHLPWAMDLGDGVLRHPVTLYEIMYLILVFGFLKLFEKSYVYQKGALFKLFMISYLFFRLLLDLIKPGWRYCLGLGSIQLACIGGLLYYSPFIVQPNRLIVSRK